MSEIKPKTAGVLMLIFIAICLVFGANAWESSLKIKQIKINGNRIVGKMRFFNLHSYK